jgi:hypothetical protein
MNMDLRWGKGGYQRKTVIWYTGSTSKCRRRLGNDRDWQSLKCVIRISLERKGGRTKSE